MKFKKLIKSMRKGKKTLFAVLIDPDKFNPLLIRMANDSHVDCFLVGGSFLESGNLDNTVKSIKEISKIPVILFPGDENQLTEKADGLFLPVLLSGRNANFLIGKQVLMAPKIKQFKLKHVPMAYLLLQGNKTSSTQKVTNTLPIKLNNRQLILDTSLAAEQLGYQLLYLEAGSGAKTSIPASLITTVKNHVKLPVIVGGGINSVTKTKAYIKAGADMIVVGNAFEKNLNLISEIGNCFKDSLKTL